MISIRLDLRMQKMLYMTANSKTHNTIEHIPTKVRISALACFMASARCVASNTSQSIASIFCRSSCQCIGNMAMYLTINKFTYSFAKLLFMARTLFWFNIFYTKYRITYITIFYSQHQTFLYFGLRFDSPTHSRSFVFKVLIVLRHLLL